MLFHVYTLQIYPWMHIIALLLDFYTEYTQPTVKTHVFTPEHIPKNIKFMVFNPFVYTFTPRPQMSRESEELEEKERSKGAVFIKP